MSLRLRLALVVVGLVAVGLLVSDSVMYASLRSFLLVRVDQQLHEAVGPVSRSLLGSADQGATSPSGLPTTGQVSPFQPPPGAPPALLPPGTYGEVRALDGTVVNRVQFTYSDTSVATPALPSRLPAATAPGAHATAFTVGASAGSSTQYRVLAVPARGASGTVIVAVPLTEVSRTLDRLLWIEFPATVGVLLGLAVLSWWIVRRGLRPLDRMGVTAAAIADGDLSRRVEVTDPRTEVGRLGLSLNAMLAQIERAFAERLASEERLRRFLADASHELRTPLTSIRGYAELFRRGAGQRPEDLASSMRRIEQESARMGVLVEDMLMLARLDQPRPLTVAPLDLAGIAADAVHDARAADPARPVSLRSSGPVMVMGDGDRLRQVASNLLTNALVHTPAGSPVEVSVAADDGMAVLTVADRGGGLSAEEVERVFEPFYRSDPGRGREAGGTGLGLSIVAAIVATHGGSVNVAQRPDGGSLFRVRLPLSGRATTVLQ